MELKKWLTFAGFLILAGISCWATEHSFHLLIKWMPEFMVWGLTIALFIVASYGTKLIFDSLDYDNYVDHRRGKFWTGVVLVILFWLLMSMPTNTHTFFYNHNIGNKVQDDIATTETYLQQISKRQNVDSTFFKVRSVVDSIFREAEENFLGHKPPIPRGNGPYVKEEITKINDILEKELAGTAIPYNNAAYGTFNPAIITDYGNHKLVSLERIKDKKYQVSTQAASEAREYIRQLDIMSDTIAKMVQNGDIHESIITQTEGVLQTSYACVKNNSNFVKFNSEENDKEVYTAENIETRTKRMLSVIDVWIDFFHGKYPISFFWYILLSILVDVGAFLFFDFTFKNDD